MTPTRERRKTSDVHETTVKMDRNGLRTFCTTQGERSNLAAHACEKRTQKPSRNASKTTRPSRPKNYAKTSKNRRKIDRKSMLRACRLRTSLKASLGAVPSRQRRALGRSWGGPGRSKSALGPSRARLEAVLSASVGVPEALRIALDRPRWIFRRFRSSFGRFSDGLTSIFRRFSVRFWCCALSIEWFFRSMLVLRAVQTRALVFARCRGSP